MAVHDMAQARTRRSRVSRSADPGGLSAKPYAIESLFGMFLGMLLAASLVVQTFDVADAISGAIWRAAVVILMLVCVTLRPRFSDMRRFALIYLPWLVAVLVGTVVHKDLESLADLAKQLFIVISGTLLYAASGSPLLRRMVFWTLFACGSLALIYSLAQTLPTLSHGWSYQAARELKAQTYHSGFGSNAICFGGLVAVLGCFRDELVPRRVLAVMAILLAVCSALLTARAPVGALVLGGVAALVLAWWQPAQLFGKSLLRTWLWVAAVWGVVMALFLSLIDVIAHSKIALALAGRAALWQIAIFNFRQNPLFGSGARTYTQVIRANLSEAHMTIYWERTALYSLQGGGVHNIWLNILTERGVVGFVGLFLSYTALFAVSIYETRRVSFGRRVTLLIILFFMLLRGFFEISGLFSYAEGAIDAVAILAVALALPHPIEPVQRTSARAALGLAEPRRADS